MDVELDYDDEALLDEGDAPKQGDDASPLASAALHSDDDNEEEEDETLRAGRRAAQKVTDDQIERLARQLGVHEDGGEEKYALRTVFVTSADRSTRPSLGSAGKTLRKFVEFGAYKAVPMPHNDAWPYYRSALVYFGQRANAAAMLLNQTARLRRVKRAEKQKPVAEDGELEEDEVESEPEDDLHPSNDERIEGDQTVEVDMNVVTVPKGRFRILTRHVAPGQHMFVRFATRTEIREAREGAGARGEQDDPEEQPTEDAKRVRRNRDSEDYEAGWTHDTQMRVRPGLEVFDSKGNELDWDYEHDTRFFSDAALEKKLAEEEELQRKEKEDRSAVLVTAAGTTIRSRGRGAKKARFLMSDNDDAAAAAAPGATLDSDRIQDPVNLAPSANVKTSATTTKWRCGESPPALGGHGKRKSTEQNDDDDDDEEPAEDRPLSHLKALKNRVQLGRDRRV